MVTKGTPATFCYVHTSLVTKGMVTTGMGTTGMVTTGMGTGMATGMATKSTPATFSYVHTSTLDWETPRSHRHLGHPRTYSDLLYINHKIHQFFDASENIIIMDYMHRKTLLL